MKLSTTIKCISCVGLLSVGLASTSHAFFFKTKVNVDASRTQYNDKRAGNNMYDNAFNHVTTTTTNTHRHGSHDIGGDVKNSIVTGQGGFNHVSQNQSIANGNMNLGSAGNGRGYGSIGDRNTISGSTAVGAQQNFQLGDANSYFNDNRANYTDNTNNY